MTGRVWMIVVPLVLALTGCHTSGKFVIPPGTDLEIYRRPITLDEEGRAEMRPFFWTAARGVAYRLLEDGEVVKEGRLESRFRPVSIFWPPGALIYWPLGLNYRITYDLTEETREPR